MSHRRGEAGAVLVELAMVVPVLFLFVFGLVDVGLLAFERNQAAAAARDGARAALVDYDQADVPASANNERVKAAAVARIDAKAPVVAVRCLADTGTTISCSTASANVDRVELSVSWNRSSITFVGGIIGQSQHISATAAMVVAGRPSAAPVIPLTTSSSTTSTSTTSTTVGPTTTTLLGCTATAAAVTPAVNTRQGSSGHLSLNFTVTVNAVACASGIQVRLTPTDGTITLAVAGPGPLYTLSVNRNTYNWDLGTQTVTILNAADGTVIANTSFMVVL
jgi:Flp pilus assembly protein TadG